MPGTPYFLVLTESKAPGHPFTFYELRFTFNFNRQPSNLSCKKLTINGFHTDRGLIKTWFSWCNRQGLYKHRELGLYWDLFQ